MFDSEENTQGIDVSNNFENMLRKLVNSTAEDGYVPQSG
jgi:hypothetical protein